jgi:nitrogen fixation protein FixH
MIKLKQIPWLPLLIGGGFCVLMLWSIFLASQRTSAVIDRDYYSHGLRYNESLLERQAAATIGWTTSTRLLGRTLITEVRDRDHEPVTRAHGTLKLLESAGKPTRQFVLDEIEPGSFQVELPADLHGEQPVEIQFDLAGARLSKRLLVTLP